jgi:hypothetical protein
MRNARALQEGSMLGKWGRERGLGKVDVCLSDLFLEINAMVRNAFPLPPRGEPL